MLIINRKLYQNQKDIHPPPCCVWSYRSNPGAWKVWLKEVVMILMEVGFLKRKGMHTHWKVINIFRAKYVLYKTALTPVKKNNIITDWNTFIQEIAQMFSPFYKKNFWHLKYVDSFYYSEHFSFVAITLHKACGFEGNSENITKVMKISVSWMTSV